MLKDTPFEAFGNKIEGFAANPLNDPAKEHPEHNLQEFLACIQAKNYAAATAYVSDQVKQSLNEEFLKQMAVGEGFKSPKIKFATDKDKKVNTKRATVYYKYEREPQGSYGQEAVMVKENGTWKVLSFGEFTY